jgi:hypothetical protein
MKMHSRKGSILMALGIQLVAAYMLRAQAPLQVFSASNTAPVGYHVDEFEIGVSADDVNRPLQSLTLDLTLFGMNQINPGGAPTVFANSSLDPVFMSQDSHFLLDPSQFTVLTQEESDSRLAARIQFDSPVVFSAAGSLAVVQAVAKNGHANPDGTYGTFSYSGVFVDGGTFRGGMAIIPEPSVSSCVALGAVLMGLFRHGRRRLKIGPH